MAIAGGVRARALGADRPSALTRFVYRVVRPPTDPAVAMLVRELYEAARALEGASEAMKHNRVTPVLITQTRAAFRRARSIAQESSAVRGIPIAAAEEVD